jgi:ACT domain-containing protein
MFQKILDEAKKEFPTTDVQGEIKKVCQNSSVINKRQTEIIWTDEQIKSMDYQLFLKLEEQQFDGFLNDNGNEREKKKQNCVTMCADSVRYTINRIAAVTLCYDNSFVSHIIREIHSKLRAHQLTHHSVVQNMFQYGMVLTVNFMEKIQEQWEKENSVPAKLESNKENLRKNFMMVSNGVAKTKLFASNMADILEEKIIPGNYQLSPTIH